MTEETANAPSISIQELALTVNIIDAAVERGAIKGNEIKVVGDLREKLVAFVKANSPAPTPETTTEETAEAQ